MHLLNMILGVSAVSPPSSPYAPVCMQPASLSAGSAHSEEGDLGSLEFSPSTRTWLRIIALSDALRLSALLCTTTLIRLLPWLMAASPPFEEKVDLYLIVTLPFSPSSFRHFLIYSASSFPDSDMQKKIIKNLFDIRIIFVTKFWKIRFCEKQCVLH